jgi:hypothetical protein
MAKTDGTFGGVTEKDLAWYRERIPNKIVRAAAIRNHKTKGWRKLEDLISAAGVFGISKAKRGSKASMAALLALEETEAVGLVAVCDKVGGFGLPERPGDPIPKPWGERCDLYLNGREMGSVDRVFTRDVDGREDTFSVAGGLREEELIREIEVNGHTYTLPEPINNSYLWGTISLLRESDRFGDQDPPLDGEGALTFEIPLKNKMVDLPVDEVNLSDAKFSKTFDCRVEGEGGEVESYNCVNWLRLLPREMAVEEYKLDQTKRDLLLL